ncbi:MAG: hypothetical protein Q9198_005616, partial [Flavoplaca austrocitrina]
MFTTGTLAQHPLNFSSPAPHIFSSVHGLLRQGYNTFFPNGFSIAPCELPAFTPFYHGWLNDEPPQSPEWLASTPEMAYGIMGSTQNSFLSTYVTTRPVKCLYLDGASGALGENGTMDMQMLFLYGNTTGPAGRQSNPYFLWDEYDRAKRMCSWLHEHGFDIPGTGIEGIVRMSAGFEVIWCNFSSPSIQLVSRFNVSVPLLGYNRTSSLMPYSQKRSRALLASSQNPQGGLPAPDWDIDWEHEPFVASQQWDWFTIMSSTYNPGDLASIREPSIRLLDAGLVSLYSPQYGHHLSSLVEHEREHFNLTLEGRWQSDESQKSRQDVMRQLMRRRASHRVGNMNPQDLDRLRLDLKRMVTRVVSADSYRSRSRHAVPWSRICDTIVNNFAKRLMHLQRLLAEGLDCDGGSTVCTIRYFASLRERIHALLMPFFEYSTTIETASETPDQQEKRSEKTLASLDRCKRRCLPALQHREASKTTTKASITYHFVEEAIGEVMDNICTVLIGIGKSVEKTWLQNFNQPTHLSDRKQQETLRIEFRTWHDQMEELNAWLGWAAHWMQCDRLCAWNEA